MTDPSSQTSGPSLGQPVDQSLEQALMQRIRTSGPIGVDDYMAACLGTAGSGYYQSRDPFGSAGDFITAPEISGLFGEMCGLYLAHMFELSSMPPAATVIELGPGRGTLMRDMRHVWDQLMPPLSAAPVRMLETSPALRAVQAELLASTTDIGWHDEMPALLETVSGPVFGIANEFFDALPVAQLVWQHGAWHQRLVGVEDGRLIFTIGSAMEAHDPALPANPQDGMVAELCPQAETVMQHLAGTVARCGGAVLIIDYGRNGNAGDSLQAVASHQPIDIFAEPGAADLSHWVNFAALSRAATQAGARLVGPVPQGRFLMRIGLAARAEQAAAFADPEERRALLAAIDRLTSPVQMGEVFKVALLVPDGTGLPPGFEMEAV